MAIGKLLAHNKKARHDYFIEDTIEAGMVLTGTEVKSIRAGQVSIKEAYADIKDEEAWVRGMHVSPYEMGNRYNPDPLRTRKLLMHKKEIIKISNMIAQKGYTLVPLKVYIHANGTMKMELGICRGKKNYDKRDSIAKRDVDRQIQRDIRNRNSRDD